MVLNVLSAGIKRQGKQLLEFFKMKPDILKWNSLRELIYKNKTIQHSYVSDLISLILSQRKKFTHLIGAEEFLQGSEEINAPRSFFKK